MESVLAVVVDAAPSSRAKAMINPIMGASLLLGTAVSPTVRSLSPKISRGMRSASPDLAVPWVAGSRNEEVGSPDLLYLLGLPSLCRTVDINRGKGERKQKFF